MSAVDFYFYFTFHSIAIQKTLLNIILSAEWLPSLAVTHILASITLLPNWSMCVWLSFCCSPIDHVPLTEFNFNFHGKKKKSPRFGIQLLLEMKQKKNV